MMQSVFRVMAILGCGDGGATCRHARIDAARYMAVRQCQADMARSLAGNTDLDCPAVSAPCRTGGPLIVKADRALADG